MTQMILFGVFTFSMVSTFYFFVFSFIKETFFLSAQWNAMAVSLCFSCNFLLIGTLSHFFHNTMIRIWYYLSFLVNAFGVLMFFLFSITFPFVYILFGDVLSISLYITVLTLFGCFLLIQGIMSAKNPIIETKEIPIKNLPKSWEQKKIVFFSDLHIGILIQERFVKKVTHIIQTIDPDIIFIAGDLFDGTSISKETCKHLLKSIQAKEGVFYVKGNHENNIQTFSLQEMLEGTSITLLDNEMVIVDNVQIIGISYHATRYKKYSPIPILKKLHPRLDIPSIVLYHDPIFFKEFESFGIDLQLSGHTHKGQIWPFGYFTKLIYQGKDAGVYTTSFSTLVTSRGLGTWGPPIRLGSTPEILVLKLKNTS